MRRKRVDLGNAGHIGNERGADGASRADEVSARKRALHQLLRGHIYDVVFAQDTAQLNVETVGNELRQLFAIQLVRLVPHESVELLLRIFQTRREEPSLGEKLDLFDHVGDPARVGHNHLVRLFLSQIRKFRKHLLRRAEIDGKRCVRIGKLF